MPQSVGETQAYVCEADCSVAILFARLQTTSLPVPWGEASVRSTAQMHRYGIANYFYCLQCRACLLAAPDRRLGRRVACGATERACANYWIRFLGILSASPGDAQLVPTMFRFSIKA